ncbi:MAG TPA: DUF4142 domain-containing protein [Bacteroidia bacterium]|jgi:putative membrane protein
MKKNIFYAALVCLFMATACNNSTDSKTVANDENKDKFKESDMKQDADFVVMACDANMLEIQLGELAKKTAMTEDVKKLAEHMIADHTKANNELKDLASKKNISVPSILSDKSQKKYDDLVKKTGIDFDKAYSDQMVSDHKDVIDAFQKEADQGKDADVKSWASGKLPALQEHLQMSEKTYTTVKDSK